MLPFVSSVLRLRPVTPESTAKSWKPYVRARAVAIDADDRVAAAVANVEILTDVRASECRRTDQQIADVEHVATGARCS